jgi:hypothetical protein
MAPMRPATPMSVPTESNNARKKNTKTTSIMSSRSAPSTSSWRNVGAIDGGVLKMPS